MLSSTFRRSFRSSHIRQFVCSVSTLPSNPFIYVFPNHSSTGNSHILTLLDTNPPSPDLAIGTTTALPPTPDSLKENPRFLSILQDVLRLHAADDPMVKGQAAAFASSSGSALGSGGIFFPQQTGRKGGGGKGAGGRSSKVGDGAGGASSQGGAGGGGRGGWVHVSDMRAPPDYGRIAWPEDIFGSLEVDGRGEFVDGRGNWQGSGTYRVVTREGILGLTEFMRSKVVEKLREEERKDGK